MPPKAKLPAPIDRPLSRAYLREFSGWSTAYPPGASQPTSCRIMENMMINREGSIRIRPGLRMVAKRAVGGGAPFGSTLNRRMVGTYETFYLNDGRKAVLFAFRVPVTNVVEFNVGVIDGDEIIVNEVANISTYFSPVGFAGTPQFTAATTYVKYLQIDNKIIALSDAGEKLIVFDAGTAKTVTEQNEITWPAADVPGQTSAMAGGVPRRSWINGGQALFPTSAEVADTPSPTGLWSSVDNPYNYGFFWTFSNDIGESVASDVYVAALSQPWGSWRWEAPDVAVADNLSPEPDPTGAGVVTNPTLACDQYAVLIPAGYGATTYNQAVADGATKLNVYLFTWSKQDSVPVEAFLVGTKTVAPGTPITEVGVILTPSSRSLGVNVPVPNKENRYNSTTPSKATNGIVAGDRMVLVGDPTNLARIQWTTNEQGNYLNFSPSKGGGFKTLTSGNMQATAAVKLWQNPQSADTLTILNLGSDGHSTSYYMAPAQVASQSDATNIMGFEETTATPGTVSPYGNEVANNTLYHPLDNELVKSTASNYNINHKSMTDLIANKWTALINKRRIVSSVYDNRIYYLVHNPEGAALQDHCKGNEVWVLDLAAEGGSWSRWLVQGTSMRKINLDGRDYLSLIRPESIYVFDPSYIYDDTRTFETTITPVNIGWRLETNTQGANRAHDAWCRLQQAGINLGNWTGRLKWGVRGWDLNGRKVDISKITKGGDTLPDDNLPFDLEDQLQVKKDMKEWFFYASSVDDGEVVGPEQSSGQITLVQYRYAPVSVNVGYEHGSIETFEYGRDVALADSNTDNGVPQPFNDQRRM
jgi:hypothetical protein